MACETEAKFKVDRHEEVRAKLVELGAQRCGRVLESNYIFDRSDGSLLKEDKGLRVRCCHCTENTPPPATLTYKGPRQKSELKHREEIQTAISDPAATRNMLKALGFVEVIHFEKWRETWRLNDSLVELDELPHLGCYVEIEGPSVDKINQTRQAVGLSENPHIIESYIALLVEHCRENHLSVSGITFEK
jgi:adenylate cyclase class 2